MQVLESGADALVLGVWGRRYQFAAGPLPENVSVQGVALFQRPPRFLLDLGAGPRELAWSRARLAEAAPERVRLVSRAQAPGLALEAHTFVEYDGMIRVELGVRALETRRIEGFGYAFELPAGVARFFNHHLAYDYAALRVDRALLTSSAGRLPDETRRLPFVPSLYLGNREVGLEWWWESNAGWRADRAGPLRFGPEGGHAALRVDPIAKPLVLAAGDGWDHGFALFPMPMRPPPERWRALRFTSPSQARGYDPTIGTRFVWIAFPGQFDARWHGLPAANPSPRQQQLRRELREAGVAYVPYAKLSAAPSLHPTVLANAALWSANARRFTGPGEGERRFLLAQGWQPGSVYGYAACLARRDYLDWMLEQSVEALRRESLDGLYYDWGAIHEPCQRDPRVRDPAREQAWNYLNLRDFYMRLRRAVQAIDPDAIVSIHHQGQPRALAAHVDVVFVGEALNVLFRDGRSFSEIRADPARYVPDYFALPPGFLEAQLLPQVGGVTGLLPEIHHGLDPDEPQRGVRDTRAFYAIALANDTLVWHTNAEPRTQIGLLRALDRFGGLAEARTHRWWENEDRVRGDPALRVTAYTRAGRALLVVANWSEAAVEGPIALELAQLDIPDVTRVRDAEAPETEPRPLADGRLTIRVPARDLRLLLLE